MNSSTSMPQSPPSVAVGQGILGVGATVLAAVFSTRDNAPSTVLDWVILTAIALLLTCNFMLGLGASMKSKRIIKQQNVGLSDARDQASKSAWHVESTKNSTASAIEKLAFTDAPDMDVLKGIRDLATEAMTVANYSSAGDKYQVIGSIRSQIVNMLSSTGLRTGFLSLNGNKRMLNPKGWQSSENPDALLDDRSFLEAARQLLDQGTPRMDRVEAAGSSKRHPLAPRDGCSAYLRVPVRIGARSYGILYIDERNPDSLTPFHEVLAGIFAPILAASTRMAEESGPPGPPKSRGDGEHV